ncbi:hypothetical protein PYCCODRAFT_748785 [Trametes coccinea BRFM310]|uniref:Uncharacterized protein n=1 Tax=Trametes coccinea (strain BRFM310) TaxID=1353009 RepID=A0A1Y2IGM2_TRAC3|nr:hypothetical protein PYCCODRAFT_748785 [Trametes coccinea BRFM310]
MSPACREVGIFRASRAATDCATFSPYLTIIGHGLLQAAVLISTSTSTSEPCPYEAVTAHIFEMLRRPYKYKAPEVGMRSSPHAAYGFVLGLALLRRWAVWYGKYIDRDFEKNLS